ncbi:MAG: cryptochrome/photolyase family protein [Verrucomicrobiales bacterium]|nr:cryptochrome/photolyase family protein [Verrucomicrobiales bacterium]
MSSLTLIFPHQLFDPHPALRKNRDVLLVEDTLFFGDAKASPGKFHRQKIVLHRASMKAYEAKLKADGYEVDYHDYSRKKPIEVVLQDLREKGIDSLYVAELSDFLLEKRIRRFCESHQVDLNIETSPMFMTPRDWADEHFDNRKKPFMAAFYEAQRKRTGILVDADGNPIGGRWSFDDENRRSMPKKGLDVPDDPTASRCDYVEEALKYVEKSSFSNYRGNTESFAYPVTHEAAETWFENFLEQRFVRFGPYEDAISNRERVLFHSLLTPALNIGLLTPEKVVKQALDYAEDNDVPLNSLEGFVRQIIGWREFMAIMYRRHGVEMRTSNFFEHDRDIPDSFWTGETGIDPIDLTIKRVLDHSYGHHIERLMVLGNFMLLCGFNPVQVNDWFMELFIDSYDWVMVPNVFGMSQFADGGIFTTKPYISGSNYIKKMSDYPNGDWCKTWDGLFWNFMIQHEDFFRKQHRLGMLVRQIDKMDADKKEGHLKAAAAFFDSL